MFNIAINTFREIIRNKYLYMILFFALLFIIFSISLGQLSIGDDNKIIVDFGLAMIEIFGLIGVVFVGSQLLFKEVEGKTIFLILSKPISRSTFILGKILGFSASIFLIVLFQALVFFGMLVYKDITIEPLIIWSVINTFLKLEIILALVLFFSTFMSNMIAIISTFLIYFIAHSYSTVIDMFIRSKNEILLSAGKIFGTLLPPFESLNTKEYVFTFNSFPLSFFLHNGLYAILYFSIIVIATIFIFSKKRFEA